MDISLVDKLGMELVKQVPVLVVNLILVAIFLSVMTKRDAVLQTLFDRTENSNKANIDVIKENSAVIGSVKEAIGHCKEAYNRGLYEKKN